MSRRNRHYQEEQSTMNPESAFRIVLARVEALAVERSDQAGQTRQTQSDHQRVIYDQRRQLDTYRLSLEEHRKALRAAKVKKIPKAPDFHVEAVKSDDDIPF